MEKSLDGLSFDACSAACSVVNRVKSDVAADQADAAYAKKDYAAADGYRQSSEFRGLWRLYAWLDVRRRKGR